MTQKYWESTSTSINNETKLILNEYLLNLKLKNKAEATIVKYRKILEGFLKEFAIPLEDISSDDVLCWFKKFSKGKKPKTVDLTLSVLSSFFKFCVDEDYLESTVIKMRWRPKIPQTLPKFLNDSELARVILAAEKFPLRDRALILFLFSSGCRSIEVQHLKIKDIDLEKRTAVVTGKGGRIRSVHFSEECAIVLNEYLKLRTADEHEPLFLNKFGQNLGKAGIYNVITRLGKKAGLKQTLSPHCCRHTFATNMLARGAGLEFIAEELGHRDLNTTRVYARIPTEDMIAAYQNIMG